MLGESLLFALVVSVVALSAAVGWLWRGAQAGEAGRSDRVKIHTNAYGELEE